MATPVFALVTVIVPAADGVGESVAVKVPELPCVIVSVLGCRLVTNGGGGLTCTVLLAVLPFSNTVIWVESTPTAVTGTGTVLWPLANEIEASTVTTAVFALTTVSVPAADGVGESIAVNVPEVPNVMVR